MKSLLVTGAEGFCGTHLIQHFLKRGYRITGGVRNRARKLAFERQYGKALVCDVSDAINLARVLASAKPDAIIHLAGASRAFEASSEPLGAYQTIVTAWANLLDGVRRVVPRARVLMISAGDVYGNRGADGRALKEDTAPEPANTFGALKAAAESIAHTFYQNYHLDLTIARPFMYVGANQPETFFFGSVARKLADWDATADGNQMRLPDLGLKRDVLHVQDVVEAYERLLEDGKPNEVYNVSSGATRTVRELVEMAARAAGKQVQITGDERIAEGQITTLCGDHAKLRSLGWMPKRSVEQAVQELVQSFQTVKPAYTPS